MKKILILMLLLLMVCLMAACGSSKQADKEPVSEDPAETVSGGWSTAENEAAVLPEDAQVAFDKAMDEYEEGDLIPVAYVASQVVAGTNYMVLCETDPADSDPAKSYKMAIIYADLEGNAQLTTVSDFAFGSYLEDSGEQAEQEQLAGGWSVPEEIAGSAIPEDAKAVFEKAVESFTGSSLEPMALLATQVVAGTNYAFLCRSTPAVEDPVPAVQVVTVYADLDGNAQISSVCTVDPASFNE